MLISQYFPRHLRQRSMSVRNTRAQFQTLISVTFACRLHRNINPRPRLGTIMRKARWLGIFALAFITTFVNKECLCQSESLLRVGKGINVFIRYGYLSISMKVISYNDTERWIFKEVISNFTSRTKQQIHCSNNSSSQLGIYFR